MDKGGVILTAGKNWHTLAATRCLGKHGIRVACGEDQGSTCAVFFSRYCSQRFSYPPFETQPENFVDAVCDFANKHQEFNVLMPTSFETYTISKYIDYIKSRSPHLKIPLHSYDYIKFANDKQKVSELAAKIKIPIPQTFYPRSIEKAKDVAARINYPAIIKIRAGAAGMGMTYVYNAQEMVTAYEETIKKFSLDADNLPIIQEYIPGTDYGAAVLFNHGALRAAVVFKALESLPPKGGMMISRVSVFNRQMKDSLIALAREMSWHGVIMADFRLDERDNTPKLLDVNPRFWFSLYQAIAAGVEFPYLLYRIAVDDDFPPIEDYKIGIRTRYFWGYTVNPQTRLHEAENKKIIKQSRGYNKTKLEDVSYRDPLPNMAICFNAMVRLARTRQWLKLTK
jgi:predicted ATP-grasp superfamily ATP-dependent carboligase